MRIIAITLFIFCFLSEMKYVDFVPRFTARGKKQRSVKRYTSSR